MFSFPWWKTVQNRAATSYSILKQDGHDVSTSSDDTLATDNTAQLARRQYACSQKRFFLSLFLNGVLTTTLAVMLAGHWVGSKPKRLVNSPVPDFDYEIRTFKLDPLFLSLPSEESNAAWTSLPGPNGRGFINLTPNNGFDYPDTKAGLSVFHQLHCIGGLRHFMWELVYGRVDTEKLLQEWPEDINKPTYHQAIHGLWHYAHCLDYLRQGVTCSADLSLEFVSENTGLAVVDGLDYPHECKNWDAIWKYAEKYG